MPSTVVGAGIPAISRMVGAMSITWVNWERTSPPAGDPVRPVDDHRVARPAKVRADLLAPLEGGVAGPRPGGAVVGCHDLGTPGVHPAVPLGQLELHLVGQGDAVLHRELVERAR